MENRSGTIAVTSDSLLIMLDWTGLRPFVNPGDPDSYREDFSGVIIGPEQQQIGRPCRGKLIRPVAHVSDLISRWQLAVNPDLTSPAELPDSSLMDIEKLERENRQLSEPLARLEGVKA
jgi:hypothetical protein